MNAASLILYIPVWVRYNLDMLILELQTMIVLNKCFLKKNVNFSLATYYSLVHL